MQPAILFDLGNTLASYYRREDFRPILELSIAAARAVLRDAGHGAVPYATALERALEENREATDFRYRPMAGRLARIFDLGDRVELAESLCDAFLGPIFATGRVYRDSFAALERLGAAGHRLGIVSNAPWGSPAAAWHREIARLGLAERVDCVVMCGDVGWRKPAPEIFRYAADRLGVPCDECLFVGDDPEWDVAGSRGAGMRPVLLDRADRHAAAAVARIRDLGELTEIGL